MWSSGQMVSSVDIREGRRTDEMESGLLQQSSCSCSTVAEAKAKAEVEAEACTSIGGRDSCRRSHVTAEASSAQTYHSSFTQQQQHDPDFWGSRSLLHSVENRHRKLRQNRESTREKKI